MSARTLAAQKKRLIELETVIDDGLAGFVRVALAINEAKALLELDGEPTVLCKALGHGSFDSYCKARFKIGRSRTYQLLSAADVAGDVAQSTKVDATPQTERQLRPMAQLPSDLRSQVWDQAVEAAGGEQPAAADVEALTRQALASLPKERQREVIAANERAVLERQARRQQARAHEGRQKRLGRATALVVRARKLVAGLGKDTDDSVSACDRILALHADLEAAYDAAFEALGNVAVA